MAKGMYIGVGGVARKVKQPNIGVNGVARKVKNGFIGVGGVARQFFAKTLYTIQKFTVSASTDTNISTYSITGSEGTLTISLTTVDGGGTSNSYNGCAACVRVYAPSDGWDGLKLSFTADVSGYVKYYALPTIEFYTSSAQLASYTISSDCSKSYAIPNGTTYFMCNVWCRYSQTCTFELTNFIIGEELVDFSV